MSAVPYFVFIKVGSNSLLRFFFVWEFFCVHLGNDCAQSLFELFIISKLVW